MATGRADAPRSPAPRDRLDIADLLARYCVALDSRDWGLLGQVFTEDATAEYGRAGSPRGLPAIVEVVRASLEPLDASQHFIGTSLIEATGTDGATGRTYVIAHHVKNDTPGGGVFTIGGTYVDRFVRTRDGWRIADRRLIHTWTQGNPAVLASHRPRPGTG